MNNTLGLYLHFPWCLRKCPYCDFNSYRIKPEALDQFLERIVREITFWAPEVRSCSFKSIYLGGGTPTLLKPRLVDQLLEKLQQHFKFTPEVEISIEGNPVTFTKAELKSYRRSGINRFSVGIQTFHTEQLKLLKRLNSVAEAKTALEMIRSVFDRFNIDLMYGLPNQNVTEGLRDLKQALFFEPTHLSWYQLTLVKGKKLGGQLPNEETVTQLEQLGRDFLSAHGMQRYEISAYAQKGEECRHNLNYWSYGDYLALGAGSHGKLTRPDGIWRYAYFKDPQKEGYRLKKLKKNEIILEFFMNRFRLMTPITIQEFVERTGLSIDDIRSPLMQAQKAGLLQVLKETMVLTKLGRNYLDDLLLIFV